MRELLDKTDHSFTEIIRDEHDESGSHTFRTVYLDDAGLRANDRIRSAKLMPQGKKLPVVNEKLDYVISFPTVDQYCAYIAQHPDVMFDLKSETEHIRLKAARRIQQDHPDWVVSTPRR